MTREERQMIAGVLELHSRRTDPNHPGWLDCRCGFGCGDDSRAYRAHVTDALIAAGVTMPAPPAIPDRAFIDDYGRRWEWCGGTEGTWAWRITAMPEPPAVCGASAVIDGIKYVCDQPTHRPGTVHQCTDGIGVMVWRDDDDGPDVVAAWTHEVDG